MNSVPKQCFGMSTSSFLPDSVVNGKMKLWDPVLMKIFHRNILLNILPKKRILDDECFFFKHFTMVYISISLFHLWILFAFFLSFWFLVFLSFSISLNPPDLPHHNHYHYCFCRARLSQVQARQIWNVLMYLNQRAQLEKPVLLTTACSQLADIGVSFCEWDLATSFR